jgi:hypothetical protein
MVTNRGGGKSDSRRIVRKLTLILNSALFKNKKEKVCRQVNRSCEETL